MTQNSTRSSEMILTLRGNKMSCTVLRYLCINCSLFGCLAISVTDKITSSNLVPRPHEFEMAVFAVVNLRGLF